MFPTVLSLMESNALVVVVCAIIAYVFRFAYTRRKRMIELHKKLAPVSRKFPKADFPPVFPNGWIPVVESEFLAIEQVKRLDVLGLELVAFRTQDGVAHVFDAYCPHLGAHLGVMGRVVGDCIECPFHGWRFNKDDGVCSHVPYAAKVPEFVKLKKWQTEELLGLVFLWFHADGEEPTWHVTDSPEVTKGLWKCGTRYEETLSCHVRDLCENESDLTHFRYFHGPNYFVSAEDFSENGGDTVWGRMLTHLWTAKWYTEAHKCFVDIEADLSVMGKIPAFLKNHTYLRLQGPALLTVLVDCKFGKLLTIVSVTPEGPFQIRVVHRIHMDPTNSFLFNWFGSSAYISSFQRDMLVWNHKTLHKYPPYQKGDKTVIDFRKWYSQFFSENSPTWQDYRDRTLQW